MCIERTAARCALAFVSPLTTRGEWDPFGSACLIKTWKQEDEVENNVMLKTWQVLTERQD